MPRWPGLACGLAAPRQPNAARPVQADRRRRRGRRGEHSDLREDLLQRFGAEVEVGIGVADEDGLLSHTYVSATRYRFTRAGQAFDMPVAERFSTNETAVLRRAVLGTLLEPRGRARRGETAECDVDGAGSPPRLLRLEADLLHQSGVPRNVACNRRSRVLGSA